MNDQTLDELIALYRQSARERPSTNMDARILTRAQRANKHKMPALRMWLGVAAALVLMLSLTVHVMPVHREKNAINSVMSPSPSDRATSDYLMRMDIAPATSPVARYLTSDAPAPY